MARLMHMRNTSASATSSVTEPDCTLAWKLLSTRSLSLRNICKSLYALESSRMEGKFAPAHTALPVLAARDST